MNLFDIIEDGSHSTPFVFVGRNGTQTVTREELVHEAWKIAAKLRSKGIGAGDTVAILSVTSRFLVSAILAVWAVGACTVVLPIPMGRFDDAWWRNRWSCMLRDANVRAICIGQQNEEGVQRSLPIDVIDSIEMIVESDDFATVATVDKVVAESEPIHKQFTSGTTGQPGVIEISHSQILCNLLDIRERLRASDKDVFLSWLPLYHDMGFIFGFCAPLIWDVPLVLIETQLFNLNPTSWLKLISEHQATISVAPPSTYQKLGMYFPQCRLKGLDLDSWRVAAVGAEPIFANALEAFADRMEPIGFRSRAYTPAYGLAEATLVATSVNADSSLRFSSRNNGESLVGCGHPLNNVALAIGSPSYKPFETKNGISAKNEGVILLKGRSIAASRCDNNGWMETGDLGFVEDGQLYISGRQKELVIVGGQNYQPVWIEDVACQTLNSLLSQMRSRCAAFQDDNGEVFLVYETRKSVSGTNQILASTIQKTIGINVTARGVSPKSIPYTTSGKLARLQCMALLAP